MAAVSITVTPVNDAPVAVGDGYSVNSGEVLNVPAPGVLANDSDVDGDPLTAVLVTGPAPGTLTEFSDKAAFLAATGATSATGPLPLLGYVGSAKVGSMTISNTSGSSEIPVALGFGHFPAPWSPFTDWTPLLPGVDLAVGGWEDLNITLDAPTFAFGFDFAEHMTISSENPGEFCSAVVSICVDSVFIVSLLSGGSPVGSFSFNAPNDVASFVGVSSTAAFDRVEIRESRTQGEMENDYFGQFYTGPAHGAFTLNPDGSFTYTPAAGFTGTDTFTYKANDGALDSNVATVTITVVSTGLPDLAIPALDRGGTTTDFQALTISGEVVVELANLGSQPVTAPFEVTIFEDSNGDGVFTQGLDNRLGQETHSGALAAGQTLPFTVQVSGNILFRDTLLYAFVDSSSVIAETDETNNYVQTGLACEFKPANCPFTPKLEWSWTSSSVLPDSLNVMMTPGVVDLNGDAMPDIVFGSSTGDAIPGPLRALNGRTGEELYTVSDPGLLIDTASSVAVGDIDNDGLPEIVATDFRGFRLIVFENDGTFKWRSPDLETIYWGAPALADLDSDGTPEIIVGRQVLNSNGSIRWTGTAGRAAGRWLGPLALVADVDRNGAPDVVAGNTVYKADGTIMWQSSLPDGYNAVADFDADPYPEIVLVTNGNVYLLEHDGSLKWGPTAIPGGGWGGPPTLADYDSDGEVEIGVAGAARYVVLETDGSIKWAAITQDRSSNVTGSSVFDFNGDGSAEVVYRDELKLRVYRGTDGAVLFETPMSSATYYEYVNVADVDADGNAELVAVANNVSGYGPQQGIYVYGSANDCWVSTRQIWNQHTYHITNINDDGTIPQHEPNNWETYNNYRQNVQTVGSQFAAPDLTASYLRVTPESGAVSLTARIGNGGSQVASQVSVAFYEGDPKSGGVLLGTTRTGTLNPGRYEDVSITWSAPPPGSHDIYVVADDDGTGHGQYNECNEQNNTHQVTWSTANKAPVANDDSYTTTAGQELPVSVPGVLANDIDSDGDPLAAIVVTGPAHGTLTLNPDGSFTYIPAAGFTGTDTFTYKANDGQLDSNVATVTISVSKRSQIVFESNRDGNYEIYIAVVEQNSGNVTVVGGPYRLTNNSAEDRWPELSRDGRRIVFTSNRSDGYQLWVMTLEYVDGVPAPVGGESRVFSTGGGSRAGWSPDGRWLAYNGSGGSTPRVFAIDPNDLNEDTKTQLTFENTGRDWPQWSPDGSQITYSRNPYNPYHSDIYVIDLAFPNGVPTGSPPRPLAESGEDDMAGWSRDGTQIAFSSGRWSTDDSQGQELYLMKNDGVDEHRITVGLSHATGPSWSPDGSKILFTRTTDAYSTLLVMDANDTTGSSAKMLVDGPGSVDYVVPSAWSPIPVGPAEFVTVPDVVGLSRVRLRPQSAQQTCIWAWFVTSTARAYRLVKLSGKFRTPAPRSSSNRMFTSRLAPVQILRRWPATTCMAWRLVSHCPYLRLGSLAMT